MGSGGSGAVVIGRSHYFRGSPRCACRTSRSCRPRSSTSSRRTFRGRQLSVGGRGYERKIAYTYRELLLEATHSFEYRLRHSNASPLGAVGSSTSRRFGSRMAWPGRGVALTGPRRLHPHQLAKVRPASVRRYQQAGRPFCEWVLSRGLAPSTADEFDDLLTEYQASVDLKLSRFASLVASVEFFFPRFRGRLAVSHGIIAVMVLDCPSVNLAPSRNRRPSSHTSRHPLQYTNFKFSFFIV